jgi:hypothetical protein
MKFEVRPIGEFASERGPYREEVEEGDAGVFGVYEREPDGCLRWVADFEARDEAERWKEIMEREGLL